MLTRKRVEEIESWDRLGVSAEELAELIAAWRAADDFMGDFAPGWKSRHREEPSRAEFDRPTMTAQLPPADGPDACICGAVQWTPWHLMSTPTETLEVRHCRRCLHHQERPL
jgi:hypothetical protein